MPKSGNDTSVPRVNILGVEVSAVNMAQAIGAISQWIDRNEPHYVCVTPAHGVMEGRNDPELRRVFKESGLTTPDGMSIVWLLHWYGQKHVTRVYGPDLMLSLCKYGLSRGWKHYFYGGASGVPEKLVDNLLKLFPNLQVAGVHSPPFRELTLEEDENITNQIQAKKPEIVWVGISTPKQERWMSQHVNTLKVPVLIGVGAAFDFLSGAKTQAPKWVQRFGMEWLFRLATEPRRLWRRYIHYPAFVFLAISQRLGFKRYHV